MKYFKGSMLVVLVGLLLLAGISLTMDAGKPSVQIAEAAPGDSNMRGRYQTLSTTPIGDLNNLNGVTSNVQTQLDAKATSSLANASAFVGNGSGVATAQSVTIINDVTATMDNAGVLNATIPASTITSAMLGATVVNSPKLDKYTLTLLVAAGATTNSVAGDTSDFYTGALLTTIGGINGLNLTNDIYYDGFGNYVMSMVNAVSSDAAWTLGFINGN